MGCTDKFYKKGEKEVMSSSDDQERPQKMAIELGLEDKIRYLERTVKKDDIIGRRRCMTQVWR